MSATPTSTTKKFLLAIASVGLALLLVELLLRLLGVATPGSFYQFDETTGHSHRPGARGWFLQEGRAFVEINPAGLRGPEVPSPKGSKSLRVAVLGDSYIEGFQVPFEQTISPLLERELAATCATDAEVIGFGVSDYGTAQELLTLQARVRPYAPDVVVLAFHTGNDIRNNSRELDPNANRPYFVLEGDALRQDDSFLDWQAPRRPYYAFISRSAILQQLDHLRATMKAARQPSRNVGAEHGVDEPIYRAPSDSKWAEAWVLSESLLLATKREVDEQGAELLLVTLSNGVQVHPDPAVREAFAARLGVDDLFYAEQRLGALGARHGISVLSLAPEFQRHAEAERVFLHGFDDAEPGVGHWNERGHALAAKLIARRLCETLTALGSRQAPGAGPIEP